MDEEISSRPTIRSEDSRRRPPEPAEIAPLFPHLEILDIVGWGGMGIVYKARQKSLDRLVALKLLPPDDDRSPTFAERFAREAKALARLQHSNIVTVHDFGRAEDYFFFLMEFVDGANLRQMMETGELTPEQALRIVPSICDALQYAHEEGIAHRDIKPENILIDRKGRVKIADFGLAKLIHERLTDYTMLTMPHQVMGTMHYMAPEQIERPDTVDHRADIYALGVVLYEMLTGELPIGRFPLPSQKPRAGSSVDVRLDEVVLKALEKEPDRRYQRASEVRTDIEQATSAVRNGTGALPQPPVFWNAAAPASHGTGSFQQSDAFQSEFTRYVFGERQPGVAYLLWLAAFLGFCGIHRMYCGKWITGILWLVTFGLLFLGQFVDLFLIPGMVDRANWDRSMRAERESRL